MEVLSVQVLIGNFSHRTSGVLSLGGEVYYLFFSHGTFDGVSEYFSTPITNDQIYST